jgi:putative transposase
VTDWPHGGFREIQAPPERYQLIDLNRLASLLEFPGVSHLQSAHRQWLAESLPSVGAKRDAKWTEAIAVGQQNFIETVQSALAGRGIGRRVTGKNGTYWLCEPATPYRPVFGAEKRPVGQQLGQRGDKLSFE